MKWEKKKSRNNIFYEFLLEDEIKVIQGTKSYNPLNDLKGETYGLRQIHSSIIHRARLGIKPVGDGLYTEERNVNLYLKTADCLPVIMYNTKKKILSMLHAGWKGTLLKIIEKFLLFTAHKYDVNNENWIAIFGPCISGENYEVGKEVAELYRNNDISGVSEKNEKYFLDIAHSNKNILLSKGISDIMEFPEETYSSGLFFSYRKGEKGKNITTARLL